MRLARIAGLAIPFGGTALGPLPDTLAAAIHARFNADPSTGWIDGGLWEGVADDIACDYFATMFLVSQGDDYTTGPGYARSQTYQFDAFARVGADRSPESVMDSLAALFNPRAVAASPILFAGGRCFAAIPGTAADDRAEYDRPGGGKFRRRHLDIRFRSDRTLDR